MDIVSPLPNTLFPQPSPLKNGVIVPKKGFQELRRVISDSHEEIAEVELGFSSNSGLIQAGKVQLFTRLVEGQFPNYQQVIPKSRAKKIDIARIRFSEALRRVSLLSQGRSYGVKLTLHDNKLSLVAEDPEFGDAREVIDISYDFDELTIGFNARYILEVLSLIGTESVVFNLTDDLSPGVITPTEDDSFLAVVMPVRI